MKKLLILTIAVTVFFGCSKNSDTNTSEVYIRLSNISEYNFKNIVVNTSTGNVDFENKLVWHNGGSETFASDMWIYPKKRITIIVLSNNPKEYVYSIAEKIASIILKK
jgi:predicted HAD superfamily phosphohydrolase YqeG